MKITSNVAYVMYDSDTIIFNDGGCVSVETLNQFINHRKCIDESRIPVFKLFPKNEIANDIERIKKEIMRLEDDGEGGYKYFYI